MVLQLKLLKKAREEKRGEIDTNGDGKITERERERAREQMLLQIDATREEKFNEIAASNCDGASSNQTLTLCKDGPSFAVAVFLK